MYVDKRNKDIKNKNLRKKRKGQTLLLKIKQ
jgi:hypothetical protein